MMVIIIMVTTGLLIVTTVTMLLIFVPKFYLLWSYTDEELEKGVPRSADKYSLAGVNNSAIERQLQLVLTRFTYI
jgi:hypothetical protein